MQWKLSFLIGAPSAVLVIIAAVVAIALIRKHAPGRELRLIGVGSSIFIAALIVVPIFITTIFPMKAEYLQYRPVAGTVQQVDKRMVRDGDGMSERYIVQVDGQAYGIDDTRAATLAEGDDVSLMCTKEWQWASTHGYACRWNM